MNTRIVREVTALDQTTKLAASIGGQLRGGELIELISDVGGGKTTFVGGLITGMGSMDRVSSPSFTVCNEYRAGSLTCYHFDFYRLNEPGIMAHEVTEIMHDRSAIIVVEWAGIIENVLPDARLTIQITATADTCRRFALSAPAAYSYLLENL
jgi:tRNA threonylcarbamoyladenosine biosynthesis protein TsaE